VQPLPRRSSLQYAKLNRIAWLRVYVQNVQARIIAMHRSILESTGRDFGSWNWLQVDTPTIRSVRGKSVQSSARCLPSAPMTKPSVVNVDAIAVIFSLAYFKGWIYECRE